MGTRSRPSAAVSLARRAGGSLTVSSAAVVLCRSEQLSVDDLPDLIREGAAAEPSSLTFSVGTPLDEVERRLISETLRHARGDKSIAAQLLGISTRTIYRKLGELE